MRSYVVGDTHLEDLEVATYLHPMAEDLEVVLPLQAMEHHLCHLHLTELLPRLPPATAHLRQVEAAVALEAVLEEDSEVEPHQAVTELQLLQAPATELLPQEAALEDQEDSAAVAEASAPRLPAMVHQLLLLPVMALLPLDLEEMAKSEEMVTAAEMETDMEMEAAV
ncbi:hypothetical protein HUJ05_011970 [Dendroctonus ponderosae]|nr:hypothetical protein HUJ05_011970 [Dendroctonus ponderosae]